MDPDPEPTKHRPSLGFILVVLLALYLLSYFPVFSYLVRHPEYQRYSAIYRPIPQPIRAQMLRVWLKMDPAGAEVTNRAFEQRRVEAGLPK